MSLASVVFTRCALLNYTHGADLHVKTAPNACSVSYMSNPLLASRGKIVLCVYGRIAYMRVELIG